MAHQLSFMGLQAWKLFCGVSNLHANLQVLPTQSKCWPFLVTMNIAKVVVATTPLWKYVDWQQAILLDKCNTWWCGRLVSYLLPDDTTRCQCFLSIFKTSIIAQHNWRLIRIVFLWSNFIWSNGLNWIRTIEETNLILFRCFVLAISSWWTAVNWTFQSIPILDPWHVLIIWNKEIIIDPDDIKRQNDWSCKIIESGHQTLVCIICDNFATFSFKVQRIEALSFQVKVGV